MQLSRTALLLSATTGLLAAASLVDASFHKTAKLANAAAFPQGTPLDFLGTTHKWFTELGQLKFSLTPPELLILPMEKYEQCSDKALKKIGRISPSAKQKLKKRVAEFVQKMGTFGCRIAGKHSIQLHKLYSGNIMLACAPQKHLDTEYGNLPDRARDMFTMAIPGYNPYTLSPNSTPEFSNVICLTWSKVIQFKLHLGFQ